MKGCGIVRILTTVHHPHQPNSRSQLHLVYLGQCLNQLCCRHWCGHSEQSCASSIHHVSSPHPPSASFRYHGILLAIIASCVVVRVFVSVPEPPDTRHLVSQREPERWEQEERPAREQGGAGEGGRERSMCSESSQ